jgi:hypothetical protein
VTDAIEIQSNAHRARRRRAVLEVMLRVIDVAVGLLAFAGGIFALVATPPSVIREVQWPPLVWVWGGLLIVGGFGIMGGRITGVWLAETSGISAAAFGMLIYLVVVSSAIKSELGIVVAATIIGIALLLMLRRYIELQEFTAEWGRLTFSERMRRALAARTNRTR